MEHWGNAPPGIDQAEAYAHGTYLIIRNGKTERLTDLTKRVVGRLAGDIVIRELPDFAAFTEQAAPIVRGANVLVALGDSTTANFSNWPFKVFRNLSGQVESIVVVNLADWSLTACDHLDRLAFMLQWLRQSAAKDCYTIFLGGLLDIDARLESYNKLKEILPIEAKIEGHKHGWELAGYNRDIPAEKMAADRWIARRTLAAIAMLERVCATAGTGFSATLQPLCYEDFAPAYLRELRALYAAEAEPPRFETWCQERRYSPDVSVRLSHDLRPVIDALRRAWQQRASTSPKGAYVDHSMLFRNADKSGFDQYFDAIHYSPFGTEMLANAITELLPWSSKDRQ